MERFKIVRKGYDRLDVDGYIANIEREFEKTHAAQLERIDMLKMEVSLKDKELKKYKDKESEINEALYTAIERAKEMDYTAKIRFTLEGERIKIFRSKWMNYCDKHRENLNIDANRDLLIDYLDNMDKEIAKVMERDINLYSKVKRNTAEEDFIDEHNRNDSFNLDDINNPPDLKSICDELDANINEN